MDELRELIELMRENEFTEFELEREDFACASVAALKATQSVDQSAVDLLHRRVRAGHNSR